MLCAMPIGSVVVLPGSLPGGRSSALAALRDHLPTVIDVDLPIADPAPLSARVCAAIREREPLDPVLVVAPTASNAILPAVALAQRSAHRMVASYVLVDPDADPTGSDWPDAPVHILDTSGDAADRARLRGWGHRSVTSASELAAAITAFAD